MSTQPSPAAAAPIARLERGSSGTVLHLGGSWRMATLPAALDALAGVSLTRELRVDASAVSELDSAAALLLLERLRGAGIDEAVLAEAGLDTGEQRIVEQVSGHLDTVEAHRAPHRETVVEHIGRYSLDVYYVLVGHLNFLGLTLAALAQSLISPSRIRLRELTAQFEQVCLNAIPVAALVTALIGVVVAYLLGLQAEQYGANIFVVDGVGIGATREFAPIIVAVIVAGRSGAAFTAQLGSMRLNEEIDAIRTLGLSPMDVLVLPRVIALMLALPLLVFIGDVMALGGAAVIANAMLDITPPTFLARLQDTLDIKHVYVGLIKAPVFALFIAMIGCRMGMTVARDTRALGIATTSTVVQGIVAVILLDAFFAVLFQEMGI